MKGKKWEAAAPGRLMARAERYLEERNEKLEGKRSRKAA